MGCTRVSPSGKSYRCYYVKCSCGKTKDVPCYLVIKGKSKSCGCLQKAAATKENKRRIGPKNPAYKSSKTNEDRMTGVEIRKSRRYQSWRAKVFKRDSYCCILCGENNGIEAHHLDGFETHKEKRYLVSNGITLCKKCHKDFHSRFMGGYQVPVKKSDFRKYKLSIA